MSSLPAWLRAPDPDYSIFTPSEAEALIRLRPMRHDLANRKPVLLNIGGRMEPLTVAIALGWAERLAAEALGR